MKKLITAAFILLSALCLATAQEWNKGELKQSDFNLSLKNIKTGDVLEQEYHSGFHGKYDAPLASSWLKAEGHPPAKIKAGDKSESGAVYEADEIDYINSCRFNDWAEMYGPWKCWDGKTDTAWCEGVEGDGIGEVVIAMVDITRPVRIWTGFGKSDDLFYKNNRPKEVEVFIIEGEFLGPNVNGNNFKLKVTGQKKLTLKDVNGWQKLDLDEYKKTDSEKYERLNPIELDNAGTFIGIKILSVYHGTKYQDTLITEISN